MPEYRPIYRDSLTEAVRHNERDQWRESFDENCNCARAIERAIGENYRDNRLNDCAKQVIEQYGFDRVNWVLANTVQQNDHDGRFSCDNEEWAKGIYIPHDNVRWHFTVGSHPGLTNLFINQARRALQALGLFERSHCIPEKDGKIEYDGKVLVMNPNVLKDAFKTPEDQLFLAKGGFGCSPDARGRKVFGQFLKDGEKTHFYREDFLGVIKDECLPEWAKEKLAEIQPPDEGQDNGMEMGNV